MFNGYLYMQAVTNAYNTELWRCGTDGTCALAKDIDPNAGNGGMPADLAVLGDKLYFAAENNKHLWTCDKQHNCERLTDPAATPFAGSMTAFDGKLYFSMYTVATHIELYRLG